MLFLVAVALLNRLDVPSKVTLLQSVASRAAPAQRLRQTKEQSHSDRSDECRDGWLQNSSWPLDCEAKPGRWHSSVRAPLRTRTLTWRLPKGAPAPCGIGAASQRVYQAPWGSSA